MVQGLNEDDDLFCQTDRCYINTHVLTDRRADRQKEKYNTKKIIIIYVTASIQQDECYNRNDA